MMIDPISYIKGKQNWSLKDLYTEKTKLEKYIKDYNENNLPEKEYHICPQPSVVASANEDYLIELNKLIEKKKIKLRINI